MTGPYVLYPLKMRKSLQAVFKIWTKQNPLDYLKKYSLSPTIWYTK